MNAVVLMGHAEKLKEALDKARMVGRRVKDPALEQDAEAVKDKQHPITHHPAYRCLVKGTPK